MYFQTLENGFTFKCSVFVKYSLDNQNWIDLSQDVVSPEFTSDTRIYLIGLDYVSDNIKFTTNKKFNIGGNIASLCSTNFQNSTYTDCTFNQFLQNSYCVDASNLILSFTELKSHHFAYAFENCQYLIKAPKLLATKLNIQCYRNMFLGCSSLLEAPELPATTLAQECYMNMFNRCISLKYPPKLPATTLTGYCYTGMFNYCSGLLEAPKLPATVLQPYCYRYMLANCTSLATAPELPAKDLVIDCYAYMFYGSSKLNYIKALFTTTPSNTYTNSWVSGVASTGIFIKSKNAAWDVTGINGTPSGWTIKIDDFVKVSCTSLSFTADPVIGNDSLITINYIAQVYGHDDNGVYSTVEFAGTDTIEIGQNTTNQPVEKIISYTYLDKTETITIIQGAWSNQLYTVNLNNQWRLSTDVSNPDSSLYEGVYESNSNYNIGNGYATMYIDIIGYTNFDLYIRSYAESNYDYVMVSQLDKTITGSTSYSSSDVKAHTRGSQKSGTTINDYTLVSFTNIDGNSHKITIVYRKDSSVNSGTDRGYVLIPRQYNTSPNLISFTIGDISYQAEEGMTWEEWVNSEYNVDEYSIASESGMHWLYKGGDLSTSNININSVINNGDILTLNTGSTVPGKT